MKRTYLTEFPELLICKDEINIHFNLGKTRMKTWIGIIP